MRKILTISIIAFISFPAMSQNNALDRLFERFSGREEFTKVVITRHMFELFSDVETREDDDYMNMIKKLNNIRILSGPDDMGKGLYAEALEALPAGEYEEIMAIKEEGNDVKFIIREKEGIVTDLVMLVKGDGETTIISITGDIDMKSIARLTRSMGIEGMEQLDNIEDNKKK